MEILSCCAKMIGGVLVEPTTRRFGYFIYYESYIEDLEKQLGRLKSKKNDLEISMGVKRREGETIKVEVKDWVAKVERIEKEVLKFMEDEEKSNKMCFGGWFPDLITRYGLAEEAKQKTMKVTDLQEEGAFDIISIPAPPLETRELFVSRDTQEFKTTENVLTKVMEALKGNNINFIGIHGMGGVGKTTLAKLILERAGKDFDKLLKVVISQNDVRTIQGQLRDQLGVDLSKEETELGRAGRLKNHLKKLNKVLLILDDVWNDELDFEAVGIPFGDDHKGCKVIITSRSASVCRTLGRERWKPELIPLGCLSDQESWDLFTKIAPDAIGYSKVSEVAREIYRECGGLPLAIVALGRALTEKDLNEWKMAAQELKKSASMDIPGVDYKIVNVLKLSYDKLKHQYAKDLFLLCCLFPEDFDILIEDLVVYGFGMKMFRNVGTIQEARWIAKAWIKHLQDVSLLLTSDKEGCIKMHDVVRDVAISIGSTTYLVRAGVHSSKWPNEQATNYIGMSLLKTGIEELHPLLECPTLQILLLGDNPIGRKVHNTRVFQRMKVLKVLDKRCTDYMRAEDDGEEVVEFGIFNGFVSQVGDLKCLTTLILDGNQFMDTSFLGEIKTLEVLSLKSCKFHEEEIKGLSLLTKLRYLDISYSVSRISSNAISSLLKLEELYLLRTRTTEPIVESILNLFPCPGVLTISIEGFEKPWPQDIILPDFEAFVVWIGPLSHFFFRSFTKVPNALVVSDHEMFDGLEKLVRKLSKRTNNLIVEDSEGMKNIIPNLLSFDDDGGGRETSQLEAICIRECDDFEYLIDNSKLEKKLHDPLLLFANLRSLELYMCPNLKTILEYSSVAQTTSLTKLEELFVTDCPLLEKIIESQDEEESEMINVQQQQHDKIIVFHRLKDLWLYNLGSLKAFCLLRNVRFEFPLLESVKVSRCPKMKTFSRGTLSTPKLKEIKLNGAVIQPDFMDLNKLIQEENRTDEVHEDEDEDEDEDDVEEEEEEDEDEDEGK